MRTPAQDRSCRGPFGALLILLSLLLSSGTAAAAGLDLRHPTTRLGASRGPASAAVLPSSIRNPSDEDPSATGSGGAVPASGPSPVTLRLWSRPATEGAPRGPLPRPAGASSSYRARAPPAA